MQQVLAKCVSMGLLRTLVQWPETLAGYQPGLEPYIRKQTMKRSRLECVIQYLNTKCVHYDAAV